MHCMHYLNNLKKKNVLIIFLLLLSYSGSVNAEWYDYLNPLVAVRTLLNITIVRPTLAVWHYAGLASVAYVEQRAAQSLAHVELCRQETELAIRGEIDPLARRIEAANRNTQEQHGILARLKSDLGRVIRADFRANRKRAAQNDYRFVRMCFDINQFTADFGAALEQIKKDNQKSAATLSAEHKKIEQELQFARVDLQNHRCDVQSHLEQQAQNEAKINKKIKQLEEAENKQARLAAQLESNVGNLAVANDELLEENSALRQQRDDAMNQYASLLCAIQIHQQDLAHYNQTAGRKVPEAAEWEKTPAPLPLPLQAADKPRGKFGTAQDKLKAPSSVPPNAYVVQNFSAAYNRN